MDGERFDLFAKILAGSSRRTLLKIALGTALGGALGTVGIGDVGAAEKPRKIGQVCRKNGDCASDSCGSLDSRGRGRC